MEKTPESGMDCIEVLNKFIEDGQPPDFITVDADNTGDVKLIFCWNCGDPFRAKI